MLNSCGFIAVLKEGCFCRSCYVFLRIICYVCDKPVAFIYLLLLLTGCHNERCNESKANNVALIERVSLQILPTPGGHFERAALHWLSSDTPFKRLTLILVQTSILMLTGHICCCLSITWFGFSVAAIYSFRGFTVFLAVCPHAVLNVNKPTSRCHSQHRHTDLYAEFDRVSISGWLGFFVSLLCCFWSHCACKVKVLDTCTSPQRFVSSLHNMACVWVCVLLSVCKERKTQR